ncbi:hypothetical protein Bca4012_042760 [Brassica carinata]|uniref:(rape) hypothetical protein n=1 Tax=Brassica napus TaxID=3708 RepID=A0A816J4V0_BRANA|nr:unnamed protein product [Brassica napus]
MCKRVQRKDAVYGDWLGSWLSRYNLALKILQSKLYQQTSRFYQRRASKIFSLVASFYAAVYVTKEKAYFPPKNRIQLKVVMSASAEVLQMYLAWRQQVCETF